MKLCQCKKGHYFDLDINAVCPYCSGGPVARIGEPYPHTRLNRESTFSACVYAGPPPISEGEKPVRKEIPQCESGRTHAMGFQLDEEAPPPVCVYAAPPASVLQEGRDGGAEKGPEKKPFLDRLKKLLRPDGRRF